MARTLALFFDGTWNNPGCHTNVWTLFKLTASDQQFRGAMGRTATEVTGPGGTPSQLTFYHPGVGAKWGEKIRGGAFGYGLSRNIRDGLLWLAQHYEPGDDLYFFGFSRGAYTARSLVGLIRKCGIPRTPTEGFVKEAYHIYREKQWQPDGREALALSEPVAAKRVGAPGRQGPVEILSIPCKPARGDRLSDPPHWRTMRPVAPDLLTLGARLHGPDRQFRRSR